MDIELNPRRIHLAKWAGILGGLFFACGLAMWSFNLYGAVATNISGSWSLMAWLFYSGLLFLLLGYICVIAIPILLKIRWLMYSFAILSGVALVTIALFLFVL
jgi:hypothetical protein